MNLKLDMKRVNEYTDPVPGKHRYYFDALWGKGHVAETNVQTACPLPHHVCVTQYKPGTESAVVIDKLSLKPRRLFHRRLISHNMYLYQNKTTPGQQVSSRFITIHMNNFPNIYTDWIKSYNIKQRSN